MNVRRFIYLLIIAMWIVLGVNTYVHYVHRSSLPTTELGKRTQAIDKAVDEMVESTSKLNARLDEIEKAMAERLGMSLEEFKVWLEKNYEDNRARERTEGR
jgi:hypothetical protein